MEKYNGRVKFDDREVYNDYVLHRNNNTNYEHDALKGNISKNKISCIYFSNTNIEALQQGIYNMVLNKSCGKIRIGKQSVDELLIIMRGIYLQYSENSLLDPIKQVRDLNTRVLNYAVPIIIEEAKMRASYIHTISNLPVPMELGKATSIKGEKSLVMNKF